RDFETRERKREAAASVGKAIGALNEAGQPGEAISARDMGEHLRKVFVALKTTAGVFDVHELSRIRASAVVEQFPQRHATEREAVFACRLAKQLLQATLNRKLHLKQLRAAWDDEMSRPAFRWLRILLKILADEYQLWKSSTRMSAKSP